MKDTLMRTGAKIAALPSLVAPFFALAQINDLPQSNINSIGGLQSLICRIAGFVFGFLIILAIVYVLVAAFRYLTAGGDPEKITKANHTLIYAAVAVAVAVLARAVPLIAGNLVGGNLGQGCQ